MQLCRESAPYPSNFLASSFGSSFGSLPTSFFGSFLASFLGPLHGYIECTEGMEATGKG